MYNHLPKQLAEARLSLQLSQNSLAALRPALHERHLSGTFLDLLLDNVRLLAALSLHDPLAIIKPLIATDLSGLRVISVPVHPICKRSRLVGALADLIVLVLRNAGALLFHPVTDRRVYKLICRGHGTRQGVASHGVSGVILARCAGAAAGHGVKEASGGVRDQTHGPGAHGDVLGLVEGFVLRALPGHVGLVEVQMRGQLRDHPREGDVADGGVVVAAADGGVHAREPGLL